MTADTPPAPADGPAADPARPLAGRTVAVTGASRGIGSAIVAELVAAGASVGALSRAGRGPEDRAVAGEVRAIACDVTSETDLRAALADLVAATGRLDAMVNNAGLFLEGPSRDFPAADFRRVIDTNVTGVFLGCREAYPHLCAAGGGTIVNLGSFFETLGTRYTAAYTASKAAVAAISRCLAVEWAKQKIRVLDVAPGFIATDLNRKAMADERFNAFLRSRIPTGEPGTPEEVARLIRILIAEDLPFLTGATITIDGAQAINQ